MGLISEEATEPLLAPNVQNHFLQTFADSILFCISVIFSKASPDTLALNPAWCCPFDCCYESRLSHGSAFGEPEPGGCCCLYLPLPYNESFYFFPWTCSSSSHSPLKEHCWRASQKVSGPCCGWVWEHPLEHTAPWPSASSPGHVCLPGLIAPELLLFLLKVLFSPCRASHR